MAKNRNLTGRNLFYHAFEVTGIKFVTMIFHRRLTQLFPFHSVIQLQLTL